MNLEKDYCADIRKLARLVTKLYESYFRDSESKIKYTQFSLLKSFNQVKYDSLMQASRDLGMEYTTISRGLFHLSKMGLIEEVDAPKKTMSAYRVTEEGKKVLKVLEKCLADAQEAMGRFKYDLDYLDEKINALCESISEELGKY